MRQLTVDFNRVVDGIVIRANARHAVPTAMLDVGSVVVVGDDALPSHLMLAMATESTSSPT